MLTRPLRWLLVAALVGVSVDLGARTRGGAGSAVPASPDDRTIVHVLNRIGYGPTPGDIERVRRIGLARYMSQQLEPDNLAETSLTARLSGFVTLHQSTRELADNYFVPALMERRDARRAAAQPTNPDMQQPGSRASRTPELRAAVMQEREVLSELAEQKILRAAYSEKQLQEVLVDFWFNHFNVFAGKGATRVYLTGYERDTIRPHVLGKFRDLLGATAESPAMLFYLDNWESAAPDSTAITPPRRGRGPGMTAPNAARKQRPRGVNENYARELMELHTMGVDGGYTQKDVEEVARAFTGWTITAPRQGGGFRFEPRMHDNGEKVILGHRLGAGGGRRDGERVLDILSAHPATSRFIALKLARRLVADEPPPALVERAASTFRETGGDLREVVRAIITSPEFFAPDAYRAKVKTPFEFVASAVRATTFDAKNARPLVQAVRDLGMPLYFCQPPNGYADRAQAWINAGALLNRMNFAVTLARGDLAGSRDRLIGDVVTTGAHRAIEHDVLAAEISESTAATVARAGDPAQAVALLLGSPEFQRK